MLDNFSRFLTEVNSKTSLRVLQPPVKLCIKPLSDLCLIHVGMEERTTGQNNFEVVDWSKGSCHAIIVYQEICVSNLLISEMSSKLMLF